MKKDFNQQTYFDSAWWKKHKAITIKDNGLKDALIAYEKTSKNFGVKTFTHDFYARVVASMNQVAAAAKATLPNAGSVKETTAKATVAHLKYYPTVIKEYQDIFDGWKDDYDNNIKRIAGLYTGYLAEARGTELELQTLEKNIKALSNKIDGKLKKGSLDKSTKDLLKNDIDALASEASDLQGRATKLQAAANKLQPSVPTAFSADGGGNVTKLTYDALNKLHAGLKIASLSISKLRTNLG